MATAASSSSTLLNAASSVVLTVLTQAGALVSDVQMVQAFVVNAIQYVELSGRAGADKLQAVLMATEVYVNNALPNLKVVWNDLAVQIRSFVNGVVALFNAIGVFVKTAVADVKGAIDTAKGALTGIAQAASPAPTLQNTQSPPQPA